VTSPKERRLRDQEPFRTIRANRRRFVFGVPLVLGGSVGAAIPLVNWSFSGAIALQLVLQTAGLLALYLPALRRTQAGNGLEKG
jgi:hypothetical protein